MPLFLDRTLERRSDKGRRLESTEQTKGIPPNFFTNR